MTRWSRTMCQGWRATRASCRAGTACYIAYYARVASTGKRRGRIGLHGDAEPEPHVLPKPLHVVRAPAVVEQAEVEAFRQVGLIPGEVGRHPFAQRHHGSIERLDAEGAFRSLVVQSAENRVHRDRKSTRLNSSHLVISYAV